MIFITCLASCLPLKLVVEALSSPVVNSHHILLICMTVCIQHFTNENFVAYFFIVSLVISLKWSVLQLALATAVKIKCDQLPRIFFLNFCIFKINCFLQSKSDVSKISNADISTKWCEAHKPEFSENLVP